MAPLRPSNVERRRLREKCRAKLSEHIQRRLGIEIKPSQVRLNPSMNDPYIWRVVPEKEEHFSTIFSKNLSDHSVGAYKELCEGVDEYFEALPSFSHQTNAPDSLISLQLPEISFGAKINRLKEENAQLSQESQQWKEKAVTESGRREVAEKEALQLYESQRRLEEEIRDYVASEENSRRVVTKCANGLERVLPVLEELKAEVSAMASLS